ncbi:TolC family protein [Desulfoluna spongiiphila]|uniref:TolC family protein n=1 Tax=Desulfoluna spongiiphila TaxID=419481 RepID=UPI00125B45D1|nr:TolC family protein [Desulfoluna spongiiphila]VVS92118.1 outer membrane efflux protein [Desulfoluna spongiiphila]
MNQGHRIRPTLFGILTTALLLVSAPAVAVSLTLPGAVATALVNNPDLQSADETVSLARSRIEKARAAFWPTLGLYAEAMRADAPSAYLFKTIDQRLYEPGTDFNDPGILTNIEGGLEVQMPLYNGGRNHLAMASARSGLDATLARQASTRQQLTAEVIDTWYDILSSRQFILIAQESVKTVTAQLEVMTVRYKGGSALKSDLLSLRVRLAEAEEHLLASRNRLELTRAALFILLGQEPDAPDDLSQEPPFGNWEPPPYARGLKQALERRCEIQGALALEDQAQAGTTAAQSGHRPVVNLAGRLYANDDGFDHSADRANWSIALRMDLPLFSGFSVEADTRSARARERQARTIRQKAVLTVRLDVKNAYLRYEEAVKRLQVARKAVIMGEETLSLVRKQYEGGSATITRYLEAELARNRARIRQTAAYYDKKKALAAIARATATSEQGPGTLFSDPRPQPTTPEA